MYTEFLSEKVKVREHLGDLGRKGRIMPMGTY